MLNATITDLNSKVTLSPFSFDFTFNSGTESNYTLSDSTKLQFSNNMVSLKSTNQTDSDNSSLGFAGGTANQVAWDSTNNVLRLSSPLWNIYDLDRSWAPAWSNLKGYWTLNGTSGSALTNGATITSDVGSFSGTVSNSNGTGFSYASGKINQALQFDGVDDLIDIPYSATLNSSSFTICAWAYPTVVGSGTVRTVLSSRDSAGFKGYSIYASGGDIWTFEYGDGSSAWLTLSGPAVSVNTWTFICGAINGSAATLYINGALYTTSATVPTAMNSSGDFFLGATGGSPASRFFIGKIDEVSFWDTVLTTTQLLTIHDKQNLTYSGKFTSRIFDAWSAQPWTFLTPTTTLPFGKELPGASGSETSTSYSQLVGSTGSIGDNDLMSGLQAYYKLNENTGITGAGSVIDSSSNALHGTPSNVTFGSGGVFYRSASFNGSSSAITLPSMDLGTQFSVCSWFWIDPTVNTVATLFANAPHVTANNGFKIEFNNFGTSNRKIIFENGNGTTGVNVVTFANTVSYAKWNHLCVLANKTAGTVDFWYNGVNVSNSPGSMTDYNTSGVYYIGKMSDNWLYFKGRIDELAVWTRILNTNEVKQMYRRQANRLIYQARACAASDCSDQEVLSLQGWTGAGSALNSFSELHNNSSIGGTGLPAGTVNISPLNILFSQFSSLSSFATAQRYFQYRAYFESDDSNTLCNYGSGSVSCSPELKSIQVGPTHYDSSAPTIISASSLGALYSTLDNTFTETLGASGCSQTAKYNLSPNGLSYYYWNGSQWALATGTYATANGASEIQAHLSSFPTQSSTGSLQLKIFLKSDGLTACELDNISISGQK